MLITIRILALQGFYIVAYAYGGERHAERVQRILNDCSARCAGIYLLHLFIGFLSPQDDPDLDPSDEPALPVHDSDEFKPFVRRLPEFKFWYSAFKASLLSLTCTFFSICDIVRCGASVGFPAAS